MRSTIREQVLFYLSSRKVLRKVRLVTYFIGSLIEWLINGFPYARANEVTDYILSIIKRMDRKKNFFVWAHFMDAHYPYFPSTKIFKEMFGRRFSWPLSVGGFAEILSKIEHDEEINECLLDYILKCYDASIKFIDYNIGRLVNYLEDTGKMDDVVLVITSDHGEEFLEHSAFGHTGRKYFTHMYEELLRVPLIILIPPEYRPVRKIREQVSVSSVDILPTIADILGFDKNCNYSNYSYDGMPIHTITSSSTKARVIFSEASLYNKKRGTLVIPPNEKITMAVRIGEWKYIFYETPRLKDELYNLKLDPLEKTNLIDEEKDLAEFIRYSLVYPHLRKIKRELLNSKISSIRRKL